MTIQRRPLTRTEEQILEVLRDRGPLSSGKVARTLGVKDVRNHLAALHYSGYLEKRPHPDGGRKALWGIR